MNMHKFLANAVVLAGFIAIPFIPFIVLSQSTFFPFIVGKNFAFRVVVEIMFSAWLVLAYIDPVYRPKKTPILLALATFVCIITLASVFGENPAKSFWSNFERMEGLVTYFHLFAYFVVASTVLTVRDMWRPYLNLHLFAGVIMAFYGVLQVVGVLRISQGIIRIDGTLGNTEYLGTYALFNIFLALFFLVRESFTTVGDRARVAVYGAIIVLQTYVLYHSGTRGAILGFIAGLILTALFIAFFERSNRAIRNGAIASLLAVILFVSGFIALRDASFVQQSPVLSRLAAISPSEGTGKSRLMVWGMAYEGFKERPLLGWGMENFNYVFNKYYDPNMWGQEQWFDRAHNVLFDWLVAGGLLGAVSYLALFGFAVYSLWRRTKELTVLEKSVLTGLLGGYLFQNLFVFDSISSLIYFGTILAYIVSLDNKPEAPVVSKKIKKNKELEEDLTFLVSGGAFIFALILIYQINYAGFMQNTTLIRALSEGSREGLSHNLALFKETVAYNSFGTSEAREQISQISTGGFDSSKGISDMQKQFIELAKTELVKQATELLHDARYQLFAGSFFARIGEPDKAIEYLNKAHELSPAKHAIFFELASVYYNKKDMVKVEELFKSAYELAPEFPTAEKYYVQVLADNGKRSLAEKILKEHPIADFKL